MADGLWLPNGKRSTNDDAAFDALSLGKQGMADDDPAKAEMRLNRKVAMSKQGMGDVTLASSRPRDPLFYWRENNLPFDIEKPEVLKELRDICRKVYLTNPVIAACVDIFSKYPLVGMEMKCFAGETEIITDEGTFPIQDLVGETVRLLTKGGNWTKGEIHSFGYQRLHKITLRRNGREREVYATEGHEWFVRQTTGPGRGSARPQKLTWDQVQQIRSEQRLTQAEIGAKYGVTQAMVGRILRGEAWTHDPDEVSQVERQHPGQRVATTGELVPGDRLVSFFPRNTIKRSHPSSFGVAAGMVYGDGSRSGDGNGCYITLWGEKDAQMVRYFPDAPTTTVPPRGHGSVGGVRVDGLPTYMKDRPSLDESTTYLYGWLAGYFAADGTVSKRGECVLSSAHKSDIDFVRTLCDRLGIITYAPYQVVRRGPSTWRGGEIGVGTGELWMLPLDGWSLTEDFFKIKEHRLRWVERRSADRTRSIPDWEVVSVERTDRVEEVFCAKVPETQCFALADHLGTSNCKDKAIRQFHEDLFFDQLDYEEFLIDVGREHWTVGEAWPFGSFNELLGVWEDDELLNPDDIEVIVTPFAREPRFEMHLPKTLRDILEKKEPKWEYERLVAAYPELIYYANPSDDRRMPVSSILLRQLKFKADTFNPRGVPILMRGIRYIIQEEMLNAAQEAVASRLYMPLILAKLGATAQDLGTSEPWIPTQNDLEEFEGRLDAAFSADFRLLTHHFAVSMESVFGREVMPRLETDFDRITEKQLQVFGLSKTLLSGAEGGQTYAADALNRDLVTQLLTTWQRKLKRFYRDRALVVAEAQQHYDFETRGGKRYPIMEEVLEVDPDGKQRIVQQPKLLVPDLDMKIMNLRSEETERQFIEALRESGVPISMRTRMVNVPVDLDDEIETVREEQVDQAVEAQRTRKETYQKLRAEGLPIPADLLSDFQAKTQDAHQAESVAATYPPAPQEPLPTVGTTEEPTDALVPPQVVEDSEGEDEPIGEGIDNVIRLPKNQWGDDGARPPESDEQRAHMPKPASAAEAAKTGRGALSAGPLHVGMRRFANLDPDEPFADDADVG